MTLNKLDCNPFYLRNFYFSGLKKVPSAHEGVMCEYSEWAWQAKIRQEVKQPQLVRHSQTARQRNAAGHRVDWVQLRLIAQQVRPQAH